MEYPSAVHCQLVVRVLKGRDGQRTKVEASGERSFDVLNIAWGTDDGDDFEHVTTNISPRVDGTTIDFFFTDEVARLVDPATSEILWESDGEPNVR